MNKKVYLRVHYDNSKFWSCPFCGETQIKLSPPCNDAPDDDFLSEWQCVCVRCGIAGPSGETEEEAVTFWNGGLLKGKLGNDV